MKMYLPFPTSKSIKFKKQSSTANFLIKVKPVAKTTGGRPFQNTITNNSFVNRQ